MAFETEFIPLQLDQLHREAAIMKTEGWRFIQTHAVNGESGVDLYYSFMKDGRTVNYRIEGVQKDQPVPSITDIFLAAFVFENEARELFGVDMRDIAIDFAGALYAPAESEPMTFITPEQKAAREKAKKAAAAKADGAGEAASGESGQAAVPQGKHIFIMTPERRARLDAKLATMAPEKVAKVEAALKVRAAEAAAAGFPWGQEQPSGVASSAPAETAVPTPEPEARPQEPVETVPARPQEPAKAAKDAALEAKLAAMDPEKAAKVRAAIAGKAAKAGDAAKTAPAATVSADNAPADDALFATREADEQLASLIALMDDAKAQVVRAALNMKGGE